MYTHTSDKHVKWFCNYPTRLYLLHLSGIQSQNWLVFFSYVWFLERKFLQLPKGYICQNQIYVKNSESQILQNIELDALSRKFYFLVCHSQNSCNKNVVQNYLQTVYVKHNEFNIWIYIPHQMNALCNYKYYIF